MTSDSPVLTQPEFLDWPDGTRIAYHRCEGKAPCVVFLPGFRSDMTGDKATTLEKFCDERGQAFLRFDYTGHGASSGEFADGTIGQWTRDAVEAIERLTSGSLVLVGSSMGGWIMLLAALALKPRIAGLVGIAAAPDFTEELMWAGLDAASRAKLERDGVIHQPSEYDPVPTPITMALIEEGRNHLLLGGPIALDCPVRLIQGKKDPDVPWQTAQRIADTLNSSDVETILVEDGDHRLSEPHDLERLTNVLAGLLHQLV
ncbi:MAG: alpha/beta hydrolase [Alphaproteobacteria bacterium]|nr:alpha/beta hydrolase [Alphaproteobacteria bacterium]